MCVCVCACVCDTHTYKSQKHDTNCASTLMYTAQRHAYRARLAGRRSGNVREITRCTRLWLETGVATRVSLRALRTVAVSRLFLDNIEHLQVSILTQGPKIAQAALGYGADDFGSIMIEENVVSAAGNKFILNAEEFERLISDAGYEPHKRNTRYELI